MVLLFYISAFAVFISLIIGLIRYEKSEYYKAIHFNSHSDMIREKYIPDSEKRIFIDKKLKEADDYYEKHKDD